MFRLYLSLSITFIANYCICSPKAGFTIQNSLLNGYVFKTYVGVEWLTCVQECNRETACFSYNFCPAKKICELNSSGLKDPCNASNILINTPGWIYHEVDKPQFQDLMPSKGSRVRPAKNINATFTCDNYMEMFADGIFFGKDNNWKSATKYVIPGDTRVISVKAGDTGRQYGILGSFSNGLVTDASWKCTNISYPGWSSPDFDDSDWPAAEEIAKHGVQPWGTFSGIATSAKWIWTARQEDDDVYCRLHLQ